jgi:exoribonuclease R
LVEKWMIFANKYIAKYLIDKNISNLIVRKNDAISFEYSSVENNEELTNYLNLKREHSALYEVYDINKTQTHSKLGNDYYTHFTSPIRRAVDLFIHGLILEDKNLIENECELQKYIEHINIFTKNSRKFDRNVKRLEFLYNSKKLEEHITTYGYIVDINMYRIRVYIPQYNLEEKIIIIPYKFKNNVKINKLSELDNNSLHMIDYTIDDINYIYKLYQRLELKLWIFTKSENIFDKLKLEIIL